MQVWRMGEVTWVTQVLTNTEKRELTYHKYCVAEMLQCSRGTRGEAALQKCSGIRMGVGIQPTTARIAGAGERPHLAPGHEWGGHHQEHSGTKRTSLGRRKPYGWRLTTPQSQLQ